MTAALSLPARLLRGFAVDFLAAHNLAAVEGIMDEAYRLSIGGHLLDGRDHQYLPATAAQLDLFPGLCVTVHDVVLSPDAVAMRFTEHGVSVRDNRASSWGGVTLFSIEGGKLRNGWAEEDYLARKRQLKTGMVDAIASPHPAPWDQPVRAPDPASDRTLARWLADPPALLVGAEEISAGGPRLAELISPSSLEVDIAFSAGCSGAFHGVLVGSYGGGFADVAAARLGAGIRLPIAGIVDIEDGRIARAQICGDRLGLYRSLLS